jgi:Tat protein secretion system quality control protein TatD with DNase activity
MSYHTNDDIGTVIVDIHGHAQLDRDRDETYHLSSQQPKKKILVKSLACSVEPDDFDITLKYAATSDFILPALGVHPWYIPNLTSYDNNNTVTDNDIDNDNDNDNDTDIDGSFDVDVDIDIDWLLPLEELLIKHPKCLVGEIGLCKIAKWVRKHPKGNHLLCQFKNGYLENNYYWLQNYVVQFQSIV